MNPWIGIETLVTRERPGGSSDSFAKTEAITLEEAYARFTVNSAKQERASNTVGRIEPGMLADLIVLDRDPFKGPVTDLHSVQVKMTFIEGEKVFDSSSTPGK